AHASERARTSWAGPTPRSPKPERCGAHRRPRATLACGHEHSRQRAGVRADPRPPRGRAGPGARRDHGGDPLQGGPRGGLAGSLHARAGARGHLPGADVRRAGGADPHRRGGGRLRARERSEPRRCLTALTGPAKTMLLADLLEELPEDLARQVFTHASWSERRGDSYSRLAFLGDSVLALAVTGYLYPRLEADRFGAGRLTKIRAQAVSGVSCRAVAERLALPERLRAAAPPGVRESAAALVETERVLASVIEAVIGACYLHAGYERTA